MSNAEQIDYWNGKVGDIWVQMQERMDLALTPVTAALLAAASPQPGELVLDIGCGAGETTLALDAVVGEGGHAIGLGVAGYAARISGTINNFLKLIWCKLCNGCLDL